MLDIIFVFVFFAFPIITFMYMRYLKINILKVNVITYLLVCLFAFGYIGVWFLYFSWDGYRMQIGIVDKNTIFLMLLCTIASIVVFLAGFTLCWKKCKNYDLFVFENMAQISKKDFILLISLLCFCCLVLFAYLSKVPHIAIFSVLFGDVNTNVALIRSDMTNNFQGGNYNLYKVIFADLLKIITFSLFAALLLESRKKILLFATFILSFIICVFVCIMDTQKAPIAWFILGLFFTYIIICLKSKLSLKFIIGVVCALILVVAVEYVYFEIEKDSLLTEMHNVISRAFAGSIQGAYFYLKYFPQYHDFLFGTSFFNPLNILPYTRFDLPSEICNWVFPNNFEKYGIVCSMPTIFWGEAYANFGFLGIFVVSFLMGILIYIECFLVNKIRNSPLKVGFYVWFIFHIAELSISGFSRILVDYYLIIIIFVLVTFKFVINKLKIKDWQ